MRRLICLSLLVVLSATGCSRMSESLSGPDPTPVRATVSGGDRLTTGQARASVLVVQDLSKRWRAVPASTASTAASGRTKAPRGANRCERAYFRVSAGQAAAPSAEAKAAFVSGAGRRVVALQTDVSSFARGDQAADVRRVEKVLRDCPHLTVDDNGRTMKVSTRALTFPTLGEETLATRMTVRAEGQRAVVDLVAVAIGHNVVTFTAMGRTPIATPQLEQIARTGVAKLATASRR